VGLQDGVEVGRTVHTPLDEGGGIAGLEEVDALVVGEEDLAGVEARRRREGAAPRGSGVVREVGSVAGVAHDHVVPARVAGRSCKDQHLLQLSKRHRVMLGGERQRTVGERGAKREPAGPSAVERLDQRELKDVLQARRMCSGLHALSTPFPEWSSYLFQRKCKIMTCCSICDEEL
jgi:hypothetical protein